MQRSWGRSVPAGSEDCQGDHVAEEKGWEVGDKVREAMGKDEEGPQRTGKDSGLFSAPSESEPFKK